MQWKDISDYVSFIDHDYEEYKTVKGFGTGFYKEILFENVSTW